MKFYILYKTFIILTEIIENTKKKRSTFKIK